LPVASAMGVPFEQIGGALAAMTRTGFNASMAATSLRQILASMLKPTHEAREALAAMAVKMGDTSYTIEGLRKTLREDGLLGALMKVDTMTKRFGEDIVAKVFPNVRALTGVLSLMGKNLENNIGIQNRVTNSIGAMNDAFAVMSLTTEQQLKLVKISFQNNLLALGAAIQRSLIPILKSLSETLNSLASWFSRLSPSVQTMIIELGGFLAILGPVGLAVAAYIKIFSGLYVALVWVGGAIRTVTLAIMANPWMAAAVGVALLATYFIQAAQAANQLSVAQRTLNDLNTIAQQSVVQESVRLESLLRLAKSEYASKEMKASAIAEINGILPAYLGGIDEEAIKTGRATTAINEYISKLKEKATLQAASDLLVDVEKKRLSDVMSGADKKMTFGQSVNSQGIMRALGVSPFGAYFDDLKSVGYYQMTNANNAEIQYSKQKSFLENLIDTTKLRIKGEEALGHVLKNNTEITTPESYLPEKEKDRMKELMELAQTASGKRLDQLMKEWVALEKIKKTQEELINMTKAQFDTTPIKPLPGKAQNVTSSWFNNNMITEGRTAFQTFKTADEIKKDQEELNKLINSGDLNKQIGLNGIYKKGFDDIDAIGKELTNTLTFIALKQKYVGDSFKGTEEKTSALKTAADGYLQVMNQTEENSPKWIDAHTKLIASLSQIEEITKVNTRELRAWRNLLNDIGRLGNTIGKYMGDSFQRVFSIISEIITGITQVLAIIKDIGDITNAVSGNGKKSSSSGGSGDWLASIIPIVTTVLPLLLAKGGVVPGGYPNDTYPALLSSGETVIPAGKSFSMLSNTSGTTTVKFRIEGRELVGILQSMGKLQQSY